MNQITAMTSEATESTLNRSDTNQPTMSLGGGGAQMQQVRGTGVNNNRESGLDSDIKSVKDAGATDTSLGGGGTMPNKTMPDRTKEPEKPKDLKEEEKEQLTETPKEMTQGELAQRVNELDRGIEKWNELLDNSNWTWNEFLMNVNKNEWDQFEKYLKDNNIQVNDYTKKETLNDFINSLMSNYKHELHGIKTNQNYDNRTDEQIRSDKLLEEQRDRDDSAYQRLVDDMRSAGLNPAAFKGANYGGGGGGGSGSRDEDEEEKRKKRRREKFEQERARKAEKMRQMELVTGIVTNLMGTATKGVGAGAYMANQNRLAQASQAHQKDMQQSANIHSRYMIEAEKLAGNKKYRKGEDW